MAAWSINDNFCAARVAESVNNASGAFPSEYGWKLCSWWRITPFADHLGEKDIYFREV